MGTYKWKRVWLMCFPSFGDWDWGHWLGGRKVKAQLKPLFHFFSPFMFLISFLSLWTVDDHSPQLVISQYTCASMRNMRARTHTHAIIPQFSWRLIQLHRNRRGWRDCILQYDSTSLEQRHADSSLMLQMYFQFESNQKGSIFCSCTLLLCHKGQLVNHKDWEGENGRINREANKNQVWYSILQWNLIRLSKGLFCASRGPK